MWRSYCSGPSRCEFILDKTNHVFHKEKSARKNDGCLQNFGCTKLKMCFVHLASATDFIVKLGVMSTFQKIKTHSHPSLLMRYVYDDRDTLTFIQRV